MTPSDRPDEPTPPEATPPEPTPPEPTPPEPTPPEATPPEPASPEPIPPEASAAEASWRSTDENPYAAPLRGTWAANPAEQAGAPFPRPPSAPWIGGWGLMTLIVGLITALGVAAAIQSNHPAIGILLIPISGLGLIAVIIRFLHSSVQVAWPAYLLISAGFGLVAYFAFVPVCIVVGIPTMLVMEEMFSWGPDVAAVAFWITATTCALLFAVLLRLYLRQRFRKQYFNTLAQPPSPAKEAQRPGDPFSAPPE